MKIRKLLKEKTRYEREFGQKYSPKYDFISKITDHPCDYAFTMVRIPKTMPEPALSLLLTPSVELLRMPERNWPRVILT